MTETRTQLAFAAYRPRPERTDELLRLSDEELATLRRRGHVTERPAPVVRTADGDLLVSSGRRRTPSTRRTRIRRSSPSGTGRHNWRTTLRRVGLGAPACRLRAGPSSRRSSRPREPTRSPARDASTRLPGPREGSPRRWTG